MRGRTNPRELVMEWSKIFSTIKLETLFQLVCIDLSSMKNCLCFFGEQSMVTNFCLLIFQRTHIYRLCFFLSQKSHHSNIQMKTKSNLITTFCAITICSREIFFKHRLSDLRNLYLFMCASPNYPAKLWHFYWVEYSLNVHCNHCINF